MFDLLMNSALIGYSGFIGSSLLDDATFQHLYNSANISSISGKSFDIVVCAGAPGTKWYANQYPSKDSASISSLIHNLSSIKADTFV